MERRRLSLPGVPASASHARRVVHDALAAAAADHEAARLERVHSAAPSARFDGVPSSAFALPRNASIPIVMLAEGIGLAAFVALLQERTADGVTMLFAEADAEGRLPHRERIAANGGTHIGRRVEDLLREPATGARLR